MTLRPKRHRTPLGRFLEDRKAKDDENREADSDEYEKLKDLSKRGTINTVRVSDSRRLFLYSSTQALQTAVQLTNTVRDRDEAKRKIARLTESHKANQLSELERAVVALSAVRSKLQAVSEKLTYTGMIRSQLTRGSGSKPEIKIVHSASNGGGTKVVGEDSELQPGDTIEVALHTEVPGALNGESPPASATEENPG